MEQITTDIFSATARRLASFADKESMRGLKRAFNTRKILALALIVLVMIPSQVYAADGDLDTTFGVAGKVTTSFSANALAIQPDGKIVAAGPAGISVGLARYNRDGSLDATFGAGGKVTTHLSGYEDFVTALAIQPDGKIVAAGQGREEGFLDTYILNGFLARYNSDGSLDLTFGVGGKLVTDFWYEAIAIQSDGKIITAGGGFALARYNGDGSLDRSFGLNGMVTTTFTEGNEAYAVAIQPDGKIVAAGATGPPLRFPSYFALARYNSDGSLDSGFGVAGKVITDFTPHGDRAYAVAIQSDGKIVAAGYADIIVLAGLTVTYQGRDFALARYNNDGSLDPTFAVGGKVTTAFDRYDTAYDIAIQFDGKIIAAGGNGADFALARYNTDGSLDDAFGVGGKVTTDFSGPYEVATAIALQSDGKIVAAGGVLARYESSPPPVTSLTFAPAVVRPGESFITAFAGPNLTDETYFDIRFRSPGGSTDQVALNWQWGASGRRTVPVGTAAGTWTVTGVRPHEDVADHNGQFVVVSAALTVN